MTDNSEPAVETERHAIKAELIRMRKYILFHGIPIGECVAWNKLKKMFGVGNRDQEDWDWLAAYEKVNAIPELRERTARMEN